MTFAVIIPVFNRPDALRACVASAHRQELPVLEIAVVDDRSTDDMDEVFEELRAGGAMVFRNPENAGPSVARNLGAAETTADWLVFLDADDELLPTALRTFSEQAGGGCGFVRAAWTRSADGETFAAQVGFLLSGTFAVARCVFEHAGGYDPAMRFGENTELLTRLRDELSRAGLAERQVDTPTVLMHAAGRSRNYDRARVTSGIHLLEKSAHLEHSPKWRAGEEAVVAVNAARVGDYRLARRYAWKAARSEPRNPKHVLRLLVVLAGPLASRYWTRNRPE